MSVGLVFWPSKQFQSGSMIRQPYSKSLCHLIIKEYWQQLQQILQNSFDKLKFFRFFMRVLNVEIFEL